MEEIKFGCVKANKYNLTQYILIPLYKFNQIGNFFEVLISVLRCIEF